MKKYFKNKETINTLKNEIVKNLKIQFNFLKDNNIGMNVGHDYHISIFDNTQVICYRHVDKFYTLSGPLKPCLEDNNIEILNLIYKEFCEKIEVLVYNYIIERIFSEINYIIDLRGNSIQNGENKIKIIRILNSILKEELLIIEEINKDGNTSIESLDNLPFKVQIEIFNTLNSIYKQN
jgi:hypothetical protein